MRPPPIDLRAGCNRQRRHPAHRCWAGIVAGNESFVAAQGAIYIGEVSQTLLHGFWEFQFQAQHVINNFAEAFFVELQRLGNIIEDAEIIHDETVSLAKHIAVGAVGARDGLQERVIAHWLVEIHGLQDGRIKTREQFGSDDQDLQ